MVMVLIMTVYVYVSPDRITKNESSLFTYGGSFGRKRREIDGITFLYSIHVNME